MRKLLGHYKLQSSICIVLIVVAAAINIYAGYQLTSFYDILNSQNIQNAIKKGFFLALVWIVAVALQYLAEGYQAYLSKLFNIHLTLLLFCAQSCASPEGFYVIDAIFCNIKKGCRTKQNIYKISYRRTLQTSDTLYYFPSCDSPFLSVCMLIS